MPDYSMLMSMIGNYEKDAKKSKTHICDSR